MEALAVIAFAAAELEKVAGWTPAKARAAEAGLGALVGGVGGAMAGSATYLPKAPVYRLDPQGFLLQRDLTGEEKTEKFRRIAKAAAGGAGLGAAGGLGTSVALRKLMDSAERDVVDHAIREKLPGRKAILGDLVESYREAFRRSTPAEDIAHSAPGIRQRRVEAAQAALEGEEKRILGLAANAKDFRRARPFGQVPKVVDPSRPLGDPGRWQKDPRGSFAALLGPEDREALEIAYKRQIETAARRVHGGA